MEIAKYFASLSVKIQNSDIKSVDAFLNNIGKGLKTNTKSTDTLEKAVKKETKTTVDGAKSKVSAQKAVNKETAAAVIVTNKLTQAVTNQQKVIRRNAESINKLFPAMGRSPLPARSRDRADAVSIYKDMFKAADIRIKDLNRLANKVREEGNLLGRIGRNSPHFANLPNMGKMREVSALGRIGKNAQAFSAIGRVQAYKDTKTQGLSREVSALGRIGRNAPTYGAVQRGSLEERLVAYRSINTGRLETQNQIEASERRILDAKRREDSRRLSHQQRMERDAALHQQRMQLQAVKNANTISRVQRLGSTQQGGGGSAGRSASSYGRANYLHAGGAAGAFARYGLSSLPLVGGVFGASAMNRANQEAISARLTTQAVVEAQGLTGQGPAAFDWLRNQANRIGFSYMDQAQDYNNFLSNSLGAGLSLGGSQDIYLGFAEYSKAMGITPARQKLVMNALSQMQGKGVVSMEELRRQMAESMPGTMSVFAEAYQTMTGGGLQGQEALAALMEAVPTGTVESAKLLPIVAELMRKRAAPKLDIAMKTSQAEQGRLQNIQSDLMMAASGAGVESGFTRMFKSLTAALKESEPLVLSMARGFDTMSRYASSVLLSVQSITRFFQGRDSLLGDKLFPDEESQAKAFVFLEQFKNFMSEMDKLTGNIYNGWSMLLEKLSSSKILDTFNTSLSIMANTAATFNKLAAGDFSGAADAASGVGKKYLNTVTAPGRAGANTLLSTFTDRRIPIPFSDADSQLDWQANYRAEQARLAAASKNQYALPGVNQPLNGMQSTNLEIKMDVNITAANPEDFNNQFQDKFRSVIESTMQQYSQKE